ncbi:MAG: SHOCT domain-containing protein [Saprospiraceae bacterium]
MDLFPALAHTKNKNWGPKEESALDMLQKRYAAGEISTEEYEERKAVLEKER